jgi:xylulokinase
VEKIVASGGATAHPLWLQLQADIFNRPIHRTTTEESAAVGAALLAGVGTGLYGDVQEACRSTVTWRSEVISPVAKYVERYEEDYGTFCRLYPALAAEGFGKLPAGSSVKLDN